jgi:hypothetical protein
MLYPRAQVHYVGTLLATGKAKIKYIPLPLTASHPLPPRPTQTPSNPPTYDRPPPSPRACATSWHQEFNSIHRVRAGCHSNFLSEPGSPSLTTFPPFPTPPPYLFLSPRPRPCPSLNAARGTHTHAHARTHTQTHMHANTRAHARTHQSRDRGVGRRHYEHARWWQASPYHPSESRCILSRALFSILTNKIKFSHS